MVISYLAGIPDRSSFKIFTRPTIRRGDPSGYSWLDKWLPIQQDTEGIFLAGRMTDRTRDVCAEYYRARAKQPPYLGLWACDESVDSIKEFTARWGILTQKDRLPNDAMKLIGTPGCPWLGDDQDFIMDMTGWIHLKRRFLMWFAAAEKKGPKARAEVMELISNEGWHGVDAGDIALGLEWRDASWVPQIKAGSLYLAFVAMLWLDLSARGRMLLRCANPKCGEPFSTERRNRIYCNNECGLQVARRRWWNDSGSEHRKQQRKPPVISPGSPRTQR